MGKGAEYTKTRRPIELVYFEQYDSIKDAYLRERQIHHWSHKKKDGLIYGKPSDIQREAKKVFKKNEDVK